MSDTALDQAIEDAVQKLNDREAAGEAYSEAAGKVAEIINCSGTAAKALVKAHRSIRLQDTKVQLTLNFTPITPVPVPDSEAA